MMNALGAVMGLKVNLINSNFETIIPGLAAGRYDVGASSFTDTKEREKTVDFVDYFNAGISFYAKTSANPGVNTVADLCGKTVAVEKGTVEQEEAEAQSKKCTKEGKKAVTVLIFTGQNAVNLAVSSGRAELGMADSPVVAYQIKQSNGAFKLDRQNLRVRPYGFAIPKTSGMTTPILAALKVLIATASTRDPREVGPQPKGRSRRRRSTARRAERGRPVSSSEVTDCDGAARGDQGRPGPPAGSLDRRRRSCW